MIFFIKIDLVFDPFCSNFTFSKRRWTHLLKYLWKCLLFIGNNLSYFLSLSSLENLTTNIAIVFAPRQQTKLHWTPWWRYIASFSGPLSFFVYCTLASVQLWKFKLCIQKLVRFRWKIDSKLMLLSISSKSAKIWHLRIII